MPQNVKPVDPSRIIRIEMLEAPLERIKGEGEYEVRRGDKPKEKVYHDLLSLEMWLKSQPRWFDKIETITTSLQNFHAIILNEQTGEITVSFTRS